MKVNRLSEAVQEFTNTGAVWTRVWTRCLP